jgi:hypothetical protein
MPLSFIMATEPGQLVFRGPTFDNGFPPNRVGIHERKKKEKRGKEEIQGLTCTNLINRVD